MKGPRSSPRKAATFEEMGEAYRAFTGDADARAKMAWLLPELYEPVRNLGFGRVETLTFGEFLEANRTCVDLYEKAPAAMARNG